MAADNIVARISGVVTFDDQSVEQFSVHIDDNGFVSTNNISDSRDALQQVDADQSWFNDMLSDLTSGNTSISPTVTPTDKTVTDLVAEISGWISDDSGTHGGFIVQFREGVLRTGDELTGEAGESAANWTAAVAVSEVLARLVTLFQVVTGPGNVTVA